NPIRLVPVAPTQRYRYDRAVVVSLHVGDPLPRLDLAGGPGLLLVLPDEGALGVESADWGRLAGEVSFARGETAEGPWTYHYRLPASIALAEAARQVGVRTRPPGRKGDEGLAYDRTLETIPAEVGEEVFLEDLEGY